MVVFALSPSYTLSSQFLFFVLVDRYLNFLSTNVELHVSAVMYSALILKRTLLIAQTPDGHSQRLEESRNEAIYED